MDVLLLDADGVVLKKGEYFSAHLASKQNIPEDAVTVFFKNEYIACQKGDSDLKVVIGPYLEKWQWQGSVDELLSYWFAFDTIINETVATQIDALRTEGVRCYMASNNERYRALYIKNVLNERELLDGYFFSSDDTMHVRKSDPEFFQKVLTRLLVSGDSVTYIDNDQQNLDAAQTYGIKTYLFHEDIFNTLKM